MAKIKFTKGELKQQRDNLLQYERYLPTLVLKKQQLQVEILHQQVSLEEKIKNQKQKRKAILDWAGLLGEPGVNLDEWLKPTKKILDQRNVAGINLPVFVRLEFASDEYDLFAMPLWVDNALEVLKNFISLLAEIVVDQESIRILREELRIATQRVNLFEKVKIPQAREAIRLIKVFLGDQMANAVGRSKIAKRKISEAATYEAIAA